MNTNLHHSIKALTRALFCMLIAGSMAACTSTPKVDTALSAAELKQYQKELKLRLQDPIARSTLIAKVFGSTIEAERHAFLKFHIYGYANDGNLIPFFTLNNYVIQEWTPEQDGNFKVRHFEVGYYSKFDEEDAIDNWENPLTGELIKLPHFALGPAPRFYGPDKGQSAASFSPAPLNITMIGDRVYIPTLSKLQFPNAMSVEEWGPYGNDPITYWDTMLVYSADIEDVLDDKSTHVAAEMHMQNLVSWAPFLKLGGSSGRTMGRAYGQHISGFDALPSGIRAAFAKHTPEIFDTKSWTVPRFDSIELAQDLAKQRADGTLDIDQDDYVPFKVKKASELEK